MAEVSLEEITADTVRAVVKLDVADHQRGFVAPNSVSISQAYFEPKAWFRSVSVGGDPVGFVMLHEDPDAHEYFLWRFMIDHRHQGRGYGRQALHLVVDRTKHLPGATQLLTSYIPGEGSPGGFYHRFGFVDTGEMEGEEIVTAFDL